MKISELDFRGGMRFAGMAASGMALLLMAASCAWFENGKPADGEQKGEAQEKKEERFAFLRKNEQTPPVKAPRETAEQEKVSPVAAQGAAIGDETLKKLEKGGRSGDPSVGGAAPRPVEKKIGGAEKAAPGVTVTPPRFYDEFIALNGDEEIPVSLIFNNAPLLDVLSAFADVLGFNFVADGELRGTVTLNLNSKMSRRELWNKKDGNDWYQHNYRIE